MWTWMRHLAAQQTTAPELATFLVLVTVVCVASSLLTYATIMTIAWAVALRGKSKKTWLGIMFPNAHTFWEHIGEYALAVITSVILGLTLAEKDRLVDAVLDMPATTFLDSTVVANVFP